MLDERTAATPLSTKTASIKREATQDSPFLSQSIVPISVFQRLQLYNRRHHHRTSDANLKKVFCLITPSQRSQDKVAFEVGQVGE